jgi:hypothetical protein
MEYGMKRKGGSGARAVRFLTYYPKVMGSNVRRSSSAGLTTLGVREEID